MAAPADDQFQLEDDLATLASKVATQDAGCDAVARLHDGVSRGAIERNDFARLATALRTMYERVRSDRARTAILSTINSMLEQLREGFHAAAHAKLVELFFHTALRQLGSGSALDPTRPLALAMCAEYATIVEMALAGEGGRGIIAQLVQDDLTWARVCGAVSTVALVPSHTSQMSLLIALLRLMRGLKKLGASKKSSFSKELLSARWSQLEQAVPPTFHSAADAMGAKDVVVRHEFERCVLFSEAHMQAVEAAFPGHSLSSFLLDGLLVLQPAQSFATDSEGLSAVAAAASKPWVPLERDDRFVPAPEQTADQSSNVAVLSVAGLALEFYLKLPVPAAGEGEAEVDITFGTERVAWANMKEMRFIAASRSVEVTLAASSGIGSRVGFVLSDAATFGAFRKAAIDMRGGALTQLVDATTTPGRGRNAGKVRETAIDAMPATARIAAWEQLVSKAAGARAQSKQRPASSSGGGSAFSAASDFASTPIATNASTSGDQPPRPSSRGDEADADVTPLAQLAAGGAGDAPAVSVAANGGGGADVVMAAVLADAAMLATQPATGQTQALANLQAAAEAGTLAAPKCSKSLDLRLGGGSSASRPGVDALPEFGTVADAAAGVAAPPAAEQEPVAAAAASSLGSSQHALPPDQDAATVAGAASGTRRGSKASSASSKLAAAAAASSSQRDNLARAAAAASQPKGDLPAGGDAFDFDGGGGVPVEAASRKASASAPLSAGGSARGATGGRQQVSAPPVALLAPATGGARGASSWSRLATVAAVAAPEPLQMTGSSSSLPPAVGSGGGSSLVFAQGSGPAGRAAAAAAMAVGTAKGAAAASAALRTVAAVGGGGGAPTAAVAPSTGVRRNSVRGVRAVAPRRSHREAPGDSQEVDAIAATGGDADDSAHAGAGAPLALGSSRKAAAAARGSSARALLPTTTPGASKEVLLGGRGLHQPPLGGGGGDAFEFDGAGGGGGGSSSSAQVPAAAARAPVSQGDHLRHSKFEFDGDDDAGVAASRRTGRKEGAAAAAQPPARVATGAGKLASMGGGGAAAPVGGSLAAAAAGGRGGGPPTGIGKGVSPTPRQQPAAGSSAAASAPASRAGDALAAAGDPPSAPVPKRARTADPSVATAAPDLLALAGGAATVATTGSKFAGEDEEEDEQLGETAGGASSADGGGGGGYYTAGRGRHGGGAAHTAASAPAAAAAVLPPQPTSSSKKWHIALPPPPPAGGRASGASRKRKSAPGGDDEAGAAGDARSVAMQLEHTTGGGGGSDDDGASSSASQSGGGGGGGGGSAARATAFKTPTGGARGGSSLQPSGGSDDARARALLASGSDLPQLLMRYMAQLSGLVTQPWALGAGGKGAGSSGGGGGALLGATAKELLARVPGALQASKGDLERVLVARRARALGAVTRELADAADGASAVDARLSAAASALDKAAAAVAKRAARAELVAEGATAALAAASARMEAAVGALNALLESDSVRAQLQRDADAALAVVQDAAKSKAIKARRDAAGAGLGAAAGGAGGGKRAAPKVGGAGAPQAADFSFIADLLR